MSDNINEVRDRLAHSNTSIIAGSAGVVEYSTVRTDDLRALLADHARLQAVVAKIGDDAPTLCDLCQVREEVCSDAEGVPFCQECWDGWQAEEAKAVQS